MKKLEALKMIADTFKGITVETVIERFDGLTFEQIAYFCEQQKRIMAKERGVK